MQPNSRHVQNADAKPGLASAAINVGQLNFKPLNVELCSVSDVFYWVILSKFYHFQSKSLSHNLFERGIGISTK